MGITSVEDMSNEAYSSFAEWRHQLTANEQKLIEQYMEQERLRSWPATEYEALCAICGEDAKFPMPWVASAGDPDVREGLGCPQCKMNGRQRAAMGMLMQKVPDLRARIYLTEQASYVYVWLKKRYLSAMGSEYGISKERVAILGDWLKLQGVDEQISLRDATNLDIESDSLDAIGSFDVLEHIPDYRRALREFARCLKKGGILVLTVPFLDRSETTLVRAVLHKDGSVEHLQPPEIHGDPVSGGVLCFYHFGWDILDFLREIGFADAAWHRTWNPGAALYGMWTLIATRT